MESGDPLGTSGFGSGRIIEPGQAVRTEKLQQASETLLPEADKGPKRFRPVAFQWSAEDFLDTGDIDWNNVFEEEVDDPLEKFLEDIREASLAFELDHNFTLVFDDIHDEEEERRENEPAYLREQQKARERGMEDDAWKMGSDQGQLDGLYLRELLPLVIDDTGFSAEKKWGLYRVLNEANRELVYGQSQDLWMELVDVDSYFLGEPQDSLDFLMDEDEELEDLYLEMIDGKTNALFAAAFYGGAYMADADDEQLEAVERYARSLGTVFQIQDDINEIQSAADPDGEDHGKGDSDLYQGKATLSFTTAYAELENQVEEVGSREDLRDLEHQKARLEHHYGNSDTSEEDMKRTAEAILEHQKAGDIAEDYIDQALGYLDEASPEGDSNRLEEFVHFMKERDY